jgi:MFS transporter, MHS family, proline/betaine transporter
MPPPTQDRTLDRGQTIASVAGNVLEWFDFSVFGYLSDILGEVFFPPTEPEEESTEYSYLVFGLAFCMRPIGGAMLGYVGDKYGRKKALVLSIFLMAFPTFIMGTLPGYKTVGGWAIVFLIVVRLLQGLSVGGQLVSSLVFLLEHHSLEHWGFYGSFAMSAALL